MDIHISKSKSSLHISRRNLSYKNHAKKGFMALKLDMSKAYERVQWTFFEHIMGKAAGF